MEILTFKKLESTHTFLAQKLKDGELKAPIMVVALEQSGGIGSRGNAWECVKDGLYFSFALNLCDLPDDLPLESISIYMGFIFKEVLNKYGANVWLKWPNDLYVNDKKAGGILCTKVLDSILVGIGVNFKVASNAYGAVSVEVSKDEILQELIKKIKVAKKSLLWKQIFSKYSLEFTNNFSQSFHYQGKRISLKGAILCEDGAIMLDGEKIYSLR